MHCCFKTGILVAFLGLSFSALADSRDGNGASNDRSKNKPVSSAAGTWWHPVPGARIQVQFEGDIDASPNVDVYDLDLVDTSKAFIQSLHDRGIKVICYFSAGSKEKWRPDASWFPSSVVGRSNSWRGEHWLDIRRIDSLKPIIEARIKLAVRKGCDAIDPDNVDGYLNKTAFPLTYGDQIAYNTMIAEMGHAAGLAVGLKNDIPQIEDLVNLFDFEVNEQCFEQGTCSGLTPFIDQNKPVFEIEYNVRADAFCPKANAMNFDAIKKNLALDAPMQSCR